MGQIDGLEFPRRPDYYALVPDECRPAVGDVASSSSEDEDGLRPASLGRLSQRLVGSATLDGQIVTLSALLNALEVRRRGSSRDDLSSSSGDDDSPVIDQVELQAAQERSSDNSTATELQSALPMSEQQDMPDELEDPAWRSTAGHGYLL